MPDRIATYRAPCTPSPEAIRAAYRRRPERASNNAFYASARWRNLRTSVLRDSPLCRQCRDEGRVTLASHVHHVKPRDTHPELAFARTNLEPLCQPCHNAQDVR
jgi:5-methylcytosine-specific restriction protein A